MASPQITNKPQSEVMRGPETKTAAADRSRFDLIYGRMKGTVTIQGDIVNPDPELWDCEIE